MIHVGLIGAGNISVTHARAVAEIPGAAVAAVYSRTRANAEGLAAEHQARAFDALDAFLEHRPLDLVIVGSPSGVHADHAIAAARRGLHVLVEKPIDVTSARADALVAEASRAGVTLGVIFQDRFKPDVVRLKSLVDEGRLGTPILATASVKWYRPPSYYAGSDWRGTRALDGGGALMNQGVHTVDLLLWLFGPVWRVSGKVATQLHKIGVEDTAVAILEFANGAIGTIEATTAAYPGYARRVELTGSNGTVTLEGDALVALDLLEASDLSRRGASAFAQPVDAALRRDKPDNAASPVVSDVSAHRAVIEDFVGAIRERRKPCCDGAEGRRSVEVIEAIYRSSEEGHPVEPTGRL
jgi:UDP-N-acetyl-2-amino-2-deoxyglucuronate dehydrogenase